MNINLHLSKFLELSKDIDFYMVDNFELVKEAIYNSYGRLTVYKDEFDEDFDSEEKRDLLYSCADGEYNIKYTSEKEAILSWVLYRIKLKGLKCGSYGNPLLEQQELIKNLKQSKWNTLEIKVNNDISVSEKEKYEKEITGLNEIIDKLNKDLDKTQQHYECVSNKLKEINRISY